MAELNNIVLRCKNSNMPIDKICSIKTYLPTIDKFKFVEEYTNLLKQHINDHDGCEVFIAFVFFNLMVVKKYTNIEINLTYEDFDTLQENRIIDKIKDFIGDDYNLLLRLVQTNNKDD